MIDFLKGWVINIAALTIFIVILEMLLPSGKVRKFVNLVSGFILMLAIIQPFLGLMKKGVDLKSFQIADSRYLDQQVIENDSKMLKDTQTRQIVEVYRRKIISQLEENIKDIKGYSGVKADVMINEDYSSEQFGAIKRVYLTLIPQKDSKGVEPVAQVEKVQVGDKDKKEKKQDRSPPVDSKVQKELEDQVHQLLGVDQKNVVIGIQGRR